MITHPETDILLCEVKTALGRTAVNKDNGDNGIPAKLFKILNDDAINMLHSMSANLENPAVATGLEKVSPYPNSQERCSKVHSNLQTIVLVSHASKIVLKILHDRFKHYVNREIPDVQPVFR